MPSACAPHSSVRVPSIAEPAQLTGRLNPLQSQKLRTWEILEIYQPQPQIRMAAPPNVAQLIPPDQMRRLNTGTPEERRAVVDALAPDVRQTVLANIPPNVFDALPDLKHQAERARQVQNEIRNREIQEQQRKMRPPLTELLTPEQARDLQ